MKKTIILFVCMLQLAITLKSQPEDSTLSTLMWYDQPAKRFEEALPLGNGRMGLMVYGGTHKEMLNLNEETLWGGGPANHQPPPHTVEYLSNVRSLLFQGKWKEASDVLMNIQGANSQSYVPMGDIHIQQYYLPKAKVRNYVRNLDLKTAISTVCYTVDFIDYRRELFISASAQVAVIKFSASQDKSLTFNISGDTPFINAAIESVGHNEFILNGQLPVDINSAGNYLNYPLIYQNTKGQKGMRYQYRVKVVTTDGEVSTNPFIHVTGATEALVFISAATSFNGFDKHPDTEGKDENQIAKSNLEHAIAKPYEQLKEEHILDYQSYFNRSSIHLGHTNHTNKPTNQRLQDYANGGNDPELETLYFNFGRYLLISASRPGGVPMNLQGIWNKDQRPPWGCNYTVNINLQMNYWPAEMFNLSELTAPLINHIQNTAVTGRQVARNYYNMSGWAAHHNSDIWAHANPVGHQEGDPKWANWALGSPWLSQHLFEHYLFTGDYMFLKDTAYPLMKSAAEFCLDWLIEKDGYLVTAPSTSPENVFIDENGNEGVVTIASTMDMEIIWDLFTNLIEASRILDIDKNDRHHWTKARERLYPLRIGKEGNLIEWYKDWKDMDPEHRHVSHLFGLHPGRQISPITTPKLVAAARRTLDIRGDGGTGWSKAWKINFRARLLDGEYAYKMYRELLSRSTLPNLFDTHPPFQIDGNFGGISGVGEMLLQSHLGEIHLLPALPMKWNSGEASGLCARGAFEIDVKWENNRLRSASLLSKKGNTCVLRTNVPVKVKGVSTTVRKDGKYFLTTFKTQENKSYQIETE